MSDSPSGTFDSLANADKSPSAAYAKINTGVTVPLMYNSFGQQVSRPPLPTVTTNLPLSRFQFGQTNMPTSIGPTTCTAFVSNRPFAPDRWITKTNNKTATTDKKYSPPTSFTDMSSRTSGLSTAQSQSHLVTWSSGAKYTTTFGNVESSSDTVIGEVYKRLHHDKEFIAATATKLSEADHFIQSIIARKNQVRDKTAAIALSPLASQCIAPTEPLSRLCELNNLPRPITESVVTMDKQGGLGFQVTVKVGHKNKNVFISHVCKSLEEAIAQAASEASQALEDLGLGTRHNVIDPVSTVRTGIVTGNRLSHRDIPSQEHEAYRRSRSPRSSPSARSPTVRSSMTRRQSPVARRTGIPDSDKNGNLRHSVRSLTHPERRRRILSNVRTPSPVGNSQRGRKRRIGEVPSFLRTPPKTSMASLLARLSLVPATDGEARVSVICNYLNIEEPVLEEFNLLNSSSYFTAHFTAPSLADFKGDGPTAASAYRQTETKMMQRLKELGFTHFVKRIMAATGERDEEIGNAVEGSIGP